MTAAARQQRHDSSSLNDSSDKKAPQGKTYPRHDRDQTPLPAAISFAVAISAARLSIFALMKSEVELVLDRDDNAVDAGTDLFVNLEMPNSR